MMPARQAAAKFSDFGDWFDGLAGTWRLEREASDGSRFCGVGRFRQARTGDFLLREEGEMLLASGETLPASRAWVWRLDGRGNLEIRYPPAATGKLYHRLRPEPVDDGWHGEAEHRCGADLYRAVYRLSADRIEIAHHVTGPAKNYRLTGRLSR